MTTEPKTKRPVGRPKKVAPLENPDCEVATKGYVKRIARKMVEGESIRATIDFIPPISLMVACISGTLLTIVALANFCTGTSPGALTLANPWFLMWVIITMVCVINTIDGWLLPDSNYSPVDINRGASLYRLIEKWKQPEEPQKKEC